MNFLPSSVYSPALVTPAPDRIVNCPSAGRGAGNETSCIPKPGRSGRRTPVTSTVGAAKPASSFAPQAEAVLRTGAHGSGVVGRKSLAPANATAGPTEGRA